VPARRSSSLSCVPAAASNAPAPSLQSLLDEDAFGALKLLLHDRVPTVAQTAALAVGRMASFSVEVAEELAQCGILEQLCASMRESLLPGHLKSGCFVLKSVCRHSAELVGAALAAGAAAALVHCLRQVDPGVREGAAQAAAALAQHAGEQAAALLAAGVAPPLVEALREPEPSLRRAAAAALGELGKHDADAAAAAEAVGAFPALIALAATGVRGGGAGGAAGAPPPPPELAARVTRAGLAALAALVKHAPQLAERAVEARLFPLVLERMGDADEGVRRAAAILVREVVKHSEQLAGVAVEAGGVGTCVQYLALCGALTAPAAPAVAPLGAAPGAAATAAVARGLGAAADACAFRGAARLPAVMALGYIAAYGSELALRVIESGGVDALKEALLDKHSAGGGGGGGPASGGAGEEHVLAACVWSLGQVGRHSAAHARAAAARDVLRHVQALLTGEAGCLPGAAPASDDLRDKCRRALGAVIGVCDHAPALLALLPAAPAAVAKMVLRALLALCAGAAEARRAFLAAGGLKAIQGLDPRARAEVAAFGAVALRTYCAGLGPGAFAPPAAASALSSVAVGGGDEELGDGVAAINALYPADVVAYCRPAYGLQLVAAAAGKARAVGEGERAARAAAREQMEAAEAALAEGGGSGGV
jgi:hypothetical protein